MSTTLFPSESIVKPIVAKPFIKWAGGKRQLIAEIANRFPKALIEGESFTYVEPFVGSGAVLFHVLNTYGDKLKKVLINDINTDLMQAFEIIKENPHALNEKLQNISNEYFSLNTEEKRKAYFLETRKLFNTKTNDAIQNTALFIYLNRTCFNGLYRVNSKGGFNVPFGRYKNPKIYNPELLLAISEALQKVEIYNTDYKGLLNKCDGPTLFYLDPPYKPISKSSSFTSYAKDSFNDENQEELKVFCDTINKKGYHFILSNSDIKNNEPENEFFDEMYADYKIERVQANRAINSKGSKRGKISELLISN